MIKVKKFNHIDGLNGQFILLENKNYWMPINDLSWHKHPSSDLDFIMHNELFYALKEQALSFTLPSNIKIFNDETQILERKRLETLALADLAKNLHAAKAEYDLETLLNKINFHLKEDDFFK